MLQTEQALKQEVNVLRGISQCYVNEIKQDALKIRTGKNCWKVTILGGWGWIVDKDPEETEQKFLTSRQSIARERGNKGPKSVKEIRNLSRIGDHMVPGW